MTSLPSIASVLACLPAGAVVSPGVVAFSSVGFAQSAAIPASVFLWRCGMIGSFACQAAPFRCGCGGGKACHCPSFSLVLMGGSGCLRVWLPGSCPAAVPVVHAPDAPPPDEWVSLFLW